MQNKYHSLLTTCPGLAGEISRWVYSWLKYDEPALALGAGISFVAALKSQRYQYQGIVPNFYSCLIADSGSGKSQAQEAIEHLINAASIASIIMGKPPSWQGLLAGLEMCSRRFLIWDEFGQAFSELSSTKNGPRALILGTLTELYSYSGRTYVGGDYADAGKRRKIVITHPSLSVFAASTPEKFFDALSDGQIEDGFLSRWIFFFGGGGKRKTSHRTPPPEAMINEVMAIEKGAPPSPKKNLTSNTVQEIGFAAPASLDMYDAQCEQNKIKATNPLIKILHTRAHVHVIKLSTILADNCSVPLETLHYAEELIDFSISQLTPHLTGLGGDARVKKVSSLMPVGGVISGSEVYEKTRAFLKSTERKQLIQDLLDNDFWSVTKISVPNTKKPKLLYTRHK